MCWLDKEEFFTGYDVTAYVMLMVPPCIILQSLDMPVVRRLAHCRCGYPPAYVRQARQRIFFSSRANPP